MYTKNTMNTIGSSLNGTIIILKKDVLTFFLPFSVISAFGALALSSIKGKKSKLRICSKELFAPPLQTKLHILASSFHFSAIHTVPNTIMSRTNNKNVIATLFSFHNVTPCKAARKSTSARRRSCSEGGGGGIAVRSAWTSSSERRTTRSPSQR